jgi:hypothetical protein
MRQQLVILAALAAGSANQFTLAQEQKQPAKDTDIVRVRQSPHRHGADHNQGNRLVIAERDDLLGARRHHFIRNSRSERAISASHVSCSEPVLG